MGLNQKGHQPDGGLDAFFLGACVISEKGGEKKGGGGELTGSEAFVLPAFNCASLWEG